MRMFVAVTDSDWFNLHSSRVGVDEVNFWRPSASAGFKALSPAELLLFKLHAPQNFIAGGGFFIRFVQLPVDLAWETFGEGNGVRSREEMRRRIGHYRQQAMLPHENPAVGCIILGEPFFWPREAWIPAPSDFKLNTVQGKGYDSETGTGRELWAAVEKRLRTSPLSSPENGSATEAAISSHGFGKPQMVLPRLGQGSFQTLLTETYQRRCAITGERTVPVLDAAHIQPYEVVKRHELSNGLIMRSDLHRLFDRGYLSVHPTERRVLVSKRIREEFDNGRDYYALEGNPLREPFDALARPTFANLDYHAPNVFR